ncbi:hypothetical protein SSX86_005967 [Deinandra increscens subsp. villosa]|uniref:Oleosin n=1 Tax=Deinandra increscens subsp. villosa TaxID=3103831 RepID=A0AAP0DQV5_9ASTR
MATNYDSLTAHDQQNPQKHQQQIGMKTMVIATVVGITIGLPLLALTGFIFLSTMALFLVASPLLILFSPLLLGAGFVIVAALAAFGAAGLLAVAGLSALGWVLRSVKSGQLQEGVGSVAGKLMEAGENVKENVKSTGKDWANQMKLRDEKTPEYGATANRA